MYWVSKSQAPAVPSVVFELTIEQYTPLSQLQNQPAVGSPQGAQPITANDRFMESFGTIDWPAPLLPTEGIINSAKGRVMNLEAAVGIDSVTERATRAASSGTAQDADALLSLVRTVSLQSQGVWVSRQHSFCFHCSL